MKHPLLLILFAYLIIPLFSASVWVQKHTNSEAIKIYVTDKKYQADLFVYVSKWKSSAQNKDEVWYFQKYKSNSDVAIKLVKYKYSADIKVYYVFIRSLAGWKKSNQFIGRLH